MAYESSKITAVPYFYDKQLRKYIQQFIRIFAGFQVAMHVNEEGGEKFWKAKDSLIGQLIEIRADAITQSIEGEHFSLRFPRFKTFRGFEPGEKI